MLTKMPIHTKSRTQYYKYSIARIEVPDKYVDWKQPFDDYIARRSFYMHVDVEMNLSMEKTDPKRWAESPTVSFEEKQILKTRITYINGKTQTLGEANIMFDDDNIPVNPMGRTGMFGPGILGKNGPNQTANPIITRWAPFTMYPFYLSLKNLNILFTHDYMLINIFELIWSIFRTFLLMIPHLEMLAIQDQNTKEWAIPGDVVEAGQTVPIWLQNKLCEEVLNQDLNITNTKLNTSINKILKGGQMIYRGYGDDSRNTDSRWIETTVMHYHCPNKIATKIKLDKDDDEQKIVWLPMTPLEVRYRNLYASHRQITDKLLIQVFATIYSCNALNFLSSYYLMNMIFRWWM